MNTLDINISPFIELVCLTFLINSVVNGLIIHSDLGRVLRYVVAGRLVGSILLALPCALFFDPSYLVIHESQLISTLLISLIFSLTGLIVNKIRKRSQNDRKNYAYLFDAENSLSFYICEIFSWVIYLLCYEILLRGLLLPHLLANYNMVLAVLINSGFYGLSHILQGKREATGALIFGFLLCFLTIQTGNCWSAFFIHLALALSNSLFTGKYNRMIPVNI